LASVAKRRESDTSHFRLHPERSRSSGGVKDLPWQEPRPSSRSTHLSSKYFSPSPNPFSPNEFPHSPPEKILPNLDKIEVAVFTSPINPVASASKKAIDPAQNQARSSLFQNILPINPLPARIWPDPPMRNSCNYNKQSTLAHRLHKKNVGQYPGPLQPSAMESNGR
jgi:hypothetical protein